MSEAGNNLMAAYSIAREGLHRRAFVRRKRTPKKMELAVRDTRLVLRNMALILADTHVTVRMGMEHGSSRCFDTLMKLRPRVCSTNCVNPDGKARLHIRVLSIGLQRLSIVVSM